MVKLYARKPNVICSVCKKPIYKRPSQLKLNNGNAYCSLTCYGISCRKETPCVVCGKLILANLHKKTCSRACANKNREGIKYHLGRPKDKVKYQQGLKLKLLNERGMKCERCGYDGYEILVVHHKNRNREDNELTNLELLCPNCHAKEHYSEKKWLKEKIGRVG